MLQSDGEDTLTKGLFSPSITLKNWETMPSRFVVLDETVPYVEWMNWRGLANITAHATYWMNEGTAQAVLLQSNVPLSAKCGGVVVVVLLVLRYLLLCISSRSLLRAHRMHAKQL